MLEIVPTAFTYKKQGIGIIASRRASAYNPREYGSGHSWLATCQTFDRRDLLTIESGPLSDFVNNRDPIHTTSFYFLCLFLLPSLEGLYPHQSSSPATISTFVRCSIVPQCLLFSPRQPFLSLFLFLLSLHSNMQNSFAKSLLFCTGFL